MDRLGDGGDRPARRPPDGDRLDELRVKALNGAGLLAYIQSEPEDGERFFRAALHLARGIGDEAGAGWALLGLGRFALDQRRLGDAERCFDESVRRCRLAANRGAAYSTFFLGAVHGRRGDLAHGERLFAEAAGDLRDLGDLWGLATLFAFWAEVALKADDLAMAAQRYAEALRAAASIGSPVVSGNALVGLAHTAVRAQRWRTATRLLSRAQALWKAIGTKDDRWGAGMVYRKLEIAREVLGPDAFEAVWAEGASGDLRQAVADGLDAARELADAGAPLAAGVVARSSQLTTSERDVLGRLAAGHPNRRIAEELELPVRTVEDHVASLYAKLGATNRVEAALHALAGRAPPVSP